MNSRLPAIVWAQWRSLLNLYPRVNKAGLIVTSLMAFLWYGGVVVAAVFLGRLTAAASPGALRSFLPAGLMVGLFLWQLIPLLLVSTGATLDVKKLIVYPIPHRQLFAIEVLLRLTTGLDVLVIMAGVAAGLWMNRSVPFWGPLWFLPFLFLNMTLSAGVRDLLARLFARKRFREVGVFLLVMAAALPQLIAVWGIPPVLTRYFQALSRDIWPWAACARLTLGSFAPADLGILLAWTGAAYLFGRWQFETGLRFDEEAAQATAAAPTPRSRLADRLYRIPSMLFPDPLGVLIEKEVRFLCRAPRFRLVFLMGFSFGLLIWMPMAFGRQSAPGFMAKNFLTVVSLYSLLLLGEVTFWNTFGFDRSAAQAYFLMPLKFSTVLLAKNITAALFVLLEMAAVIAVCRLVNVQLPAGKVFEAFCVTAVVTIYLVGIGNLSSTHYPAPVDPSQSWRSRGAGRFHALLLLIYPLVSIPVSLSYLARWAFDSDLAFYAGLSVALLVGCVVYWMSMESAVSGAHARREQILASLSKQDSPISLA